MDLSAWVLENHSTLLEKIHSRVSLKGTLEEVLLSVFSNDVRGLAECEGYTLLDHQVWASARGAAATPGADRTYLMLFLTKAGVGTSVIYRIVVLSDERCGESEGRCFCGHRVYVNIAVSVERSFAFAPGFTSSFDIYSNYTFNDLYSKRLTTFSGTGAVRVGLSLNEDIVDRYYGIEEDEVVLLMESYRSGTRYTGGALGATVYEFPLYLVSIILCDELSVEYGEQVSGTLSRFSSERLPGRTRLDSGYWIENVLVDYFLVQEVSWFSSECDRLVSEYGFGGEGYGPGSDTGVGG